MNNTESRMPQPRVIIPYDVYQRLRAYVLNCPTEINGYGMVEAHEGLIWITEVFITEQVAQMAHVEAPPEAVNDLVLKLMEEGRDIGRVKCQWHSHVNMRAYCSSTDTAAIDDWVGDWLVSLVLNKQGDIYCRLDYFQGPRLGIEIEPEIIHRLPQALLEDTADEIHRKVHRPGTRFRKGKPLTNGAPGPTHSFVVRPDTIHTIATEEDA